MVSSGRRTPDETRWWIVDCQWEEGAALQGDFVTPPTRALPAFTEKTAEKKKFPFSVRESCWSAWGNFLAKLKNPQPSEATSIAK